MTDATTRTAAWTLTRTLTLAAALLPLTLAPALVAAGLGKTAGRGPVAAPSFAASLIEGPATSTTAAASCDATPAPTPRRRPPADEGCRDTSIVAAVK